MKDIVNSLNALISVDFHCLDLMSTKSIREFVEYFEKKNLPLHYLVNNGKYQVEAGRESDRIR